MHGDFYVGHSAVRSAAVYWQSARPQNCDPATDSDYSESKTFTLYLYTRILSSDQLVT